MSAAGAVSNAGPAGSALPPAGLPRLIQPGGDEPGPGRALVPDRGQQAQGHAHGQQDQRDQAGSPGEVPEGRGGVDHDGARRPGCG